MKAILPSPSIRYVVGSESTCGIDPRGFPVLGHPAARRHSISQAYRRFRRWVGQLGGLSVLEVNYPNLGVFHILVWHGGVVLIGSLAGALLGAALECVERGHRQRGHWSLRPDRSVFSPPDGSWRHATCVECFPAIVAYLGAELGTATGSALRSVESTSCYRTPDTQACQ